MDYLKTKGRIFDIQRFSVHDGPGVRTIVFLKGCFLRCKWCCNPESQEYEIQQMTRNGKVQTVGYDVTVAEVMEQIEKDRVYYRRSNGGVTLSGGESLAQPEFAASLLRACKQAGINTAIESTACAPFEVIEKILPYLDLYLLDIKHLNSEKHQRFTTKPNDLILENAKKIAKSSTELVIRVPVIPTFNDTVDEISDIANFAARLDGVRE
ncbi:MAG: glycyl-radical enzyme activating protein, partial [bacterium]|nr:glycyl-radical enzyme activating protein [bacterium]